MSLLGLVGVVGISWPVFTGLEGSGLDGVEASLALVGHVGDVAVIAVDDVRDLLQAAVGELHVVGSLGVVAVTGLLVSELVAGGVIADGPLEVVLGLSGLEGFLRGVLQEYISFKRRGSDHINVTI